jgi:hypothetical protein
MIIIIVVARFPNLKAQEQTSWEFSYTNIYHSFFPVRAMCDWSLFNDWPFGFAQHSQPVASVPDQRLTVERWLLSTCWLVIIAK